MRILGIEVNLSFKSTSLDEVIQADEEYAALQVKADGGRNEEYSTRADDLADEMGKKGFLPHWDRANKTWYFVDD